MICTLVAVLSLSLPVLAQGAIPTAFDECVDLMSLVFRLAGVREYNTCPVTPYTEEADKYFATFREHKVVLLAQQYRREHGIGYDAVASMGCHLKIENGQVVMNDLLENRIDERWTPAMQQDFLGALNAFYAESGFHRWFASTLPVQEVCLKAFGQLSCRIDLSWYGSFFKQTEADFRIILCPLAGKNNYGIDCFKKDGGHVLSPVISSTSYKDGQIFYDNSAFTIMVHEFCHAYCNPLVDKYWEQMAQTAEQLFTQKQDVLASQAYTSAKIMMYESVVRASVIQYMQQHFTPEQVNFQALIADEEEKGFLLIRSLLQAFRQYEQEKTGYPDMEAFMPVLLKEISAFSMEKYLAQQEEADKQKMRYKVNIANGAKDVPAGDFTLTVTFDEPLYNPGISMNMTDVEFPEFKGYSWSADNRVLTVNFHLDPGKTYGFKINGASYRTKDGKIAVDSEFKFKTASR